MFINKKKFNSQIRYLLKKFIMLPVFTYIYNQYCLEHSFVKHGDVLQFYVRYIFNSAAELYK